MKRASLLFLASLGATGCVGSGSSPIPDAGAIAPPTGDDASIALPDTGMNDSAPPPPVDAGGDSGQTSCLGSTLCPDGTCHDLTSDHANCGGCGQACGAGLFCSNGACAASCAAGRVACGGSCVDPMTSPTNCGASGDCTGGNAGSACAAGRACISGQCVDACGSTSNASIRACNGVCVDTDFDPSNCGGCGTKCPATANGSPVCLHGACGVTACPANFADCDGDPTNGCEVDLLTTTNDCGACGVQCMAGACNAGRCPNDPEWSSGPLPPDVRSGGDFVVEHLGTLYDVDGGVIDAGLDTISDAAIDAIANGTNVDAAACNEAGAVTNVGTTSCNYGTEGAGGTCDDVVYDKLTGLLWQRFPTANAASVAAAKCYCGSLQVAGLDGWRLPTRLELATLTDFARANPAVNLGAFPALDGGAGITRLLSSSLSKPLPTNPYVYEMYLNDGEEDEWGAGGGNAYSILCVRATPPTGENVPPRRYQITTNGTPDDISDDTVLDVVTQLRWERAFSPPVAWDPSASLGSAQAYCASLSVGTYTSGWRLPGVRELQTLIDVRHHPVFDPATFPGIPIGPVTGENHRFWTATPSMFNTTTDDAGVVTSTAGWVIGLGQGHSIPWRLGSAASPNLNVARCVHAP